MVSGDVHHSLSVQDTPKKQFAADNERFTRKTDIILIGGGIAGSLAAAMLGRAGYHGLLVDPQSNFPKCFRGEKFVPEQVDLLEQTGLTEALSTSLKRFDTTSVFSFGRMYEIRPEKQFGFSYEVLVDAVRREVPSTFEFIPAKAVDVETSDDWQAVELSNGERISARLVVLASGHSLSLLRRLGMERNVLSKHHSLSIGFDIGLVDGSEFGFSSLTYHPVFKAERISYLTIFPIGNSMRANLFTYWEMDGPQLRRLRANPVETLCQTLPNLNNVIGDFELTSPLSIRPIDLYTTENYIQSGVVLVGDAFSVGCPVTGLGFTKVLTDVTRLCGVHIPKWFADDGMSAEKISSFYGDHVRATLLATSQIRAFRERAMAVDPSLKLKLRHWARSAYYFGRGSVRNIFSSEAGQHWRSTEANIQPAPYPYQMTNSSS